MSDRDTWKGKPVITVSLECGIRECGYISHFGGTTSSTGSFATEARNLGWRRSGNLGWVCPQCWAKTETYEGEESR
jgi:hypothetical protein